MGTRIGALELGLARPERFELPTPKFVVWCSIQLSYGRVGRRTEKADDGRIAIGSAPPWQGTQRPWPDNGLSDPAARAGQGASRRRRIAVGTGDQRARIGCRCVPRLRLHWGAARKMQPHPQARRIVAQLDVCAVHPRDRRDEA